MYIEEAWKKFIKIVLENGEKHEKDDGDILQEHLINHCIIDNPLKQIGNTNIKGEQFIDLIKKGVFDIKHYPMKGEALAEYVSSLDDEYIIKSSDFIYTYPERIFNIHQVDRNDVINNINQFEVVCDRLRENDGSNRAVMTLYSSALDKDQQHIPCLQFIQATIRNNKLMLHIFFRSNDLYSAFPSNMLFISYLGIKLTEELKKEYPLLEFVGINYNSSSLHIYKSDLKQARDVLDD